MCFKKRETRHSSHKISKSKTSEVTNPRIFPGTDNEFEMVSNMTMGLLVRQMSDLLKQAENMFGDLEEEVKMVVVRSNMIQSRVSRLQDTVNNMDFMEEKIG